MLLQSKPQNSLSERKQACVLRGVGLHILLEGALRCLIGGVSMLAPSYFIAMIKVLLVDDNSMMRTAIHRALKDFEGMKVEGECEDGDEVLNFLSQHEVDVILMDIDMKRMDGLEATKLLKASYPDVKVIGFSTHDSDSLGKHMIRAGASAYLEKTAGLEDLKRTIERVAASDTAP